MLDKKYQDEIDDIIRQLEEQEDVQIDMEALNNLEDEIYPDPRDVEYEV